MNRIIIKYWNETGTISSCLRIYNDIKGYDCEQIGCPFYGREADIMWEYFKNTIIKENDKVMSYGLYVDGEVFNGDEIDELLGGKE